MKTIGRQALWSVSEDGELCEKDCMEVRMDAPYKVDNYMQLATKVAELQYKNPDYVLLFRGQRQDFARENSDGHTYTSLSPALFRKHDGRNPPPSILRLRFEALKRAEESLIAAYERKFPDVDRLERQEILRWSILQHYEICATPLLDVTHSLRIAASFASDGAEARAFLFVLGVPNLSGSVTASAEAGIQIVRLASVCPPNALRPHIQEGYLLGEYPELSGYERKRLYPSVEVDFGRRLLAKFEFDPEAFWGSSGYFPQVSRPALYPNKHDPLYKLAREVKGKLQRVE
jgi:hypothetical protein